MRNIGKFYIDGKWIDPISASTHTLINPADETPIAEIPMAGAADVDRAVAAAKAAFDTYSMTSREARLALLNRLLDLYNGAYDEIAELMSVSRNTVMTFVRRIYQKLEVRSKAEAIFEARSHGIL